MSYIPQDEGNEQCQNCEHWYISMGCVPSHFRDGPPPCGRDFTGKGRTAMQEKARKIVLNYFNSHVDATDNAQLTMDDVYVVWFCKTLQNWKALVSTTVPDGKYYEVTYNGDKKEAYLDVYVKLENKVVHDIDAEKA